MKKRNNRLVLLLTSLAVCISAVSGCGKLDGTKTVATCNGENISLGLANFVTRYMQASYKQYYSYFGSEIKWDEKQQDDDATVGEGLKDTIMDMLEEMYLLKQNAAEYNITLSDEDNSKIEETAQRIMKDNAGKAQENIAFSKDDVVNYLGLITYQSRVQKAIKDGADRNVSDDEAKQTTITYVPIEKKTPETTNGEPPATETTSGEPELTDEQRKENAQKILDKLKAAQDVPSADMDALAKEVDSNLAAIDKSYGADDEDVESRLKDAVKDLKDGTVADSVIEGDTAFYVVRMNAQFDKDATENKKKEIIAEREDKKYTEVLDGWKEKASFDVKNSVWKDVKVNDIDTFEFVESTEGEASETTSGEAADSTATDSTAGDSAAKDSSAATDSATKDSAAATDSTAKDSAAAADSAAKDSSAATDSAAKDSAAN